MDYSKHLRVIEVKQLNATQNRGERIKLIDRRMGQSKTLGYNYKYNSNKEQAWGWLKENGLNPIVWGENIIMCDDWKNFHELDKM